MLICFPFFEDDKGQAKAVAEHIRDLGGVGSHQCLVVHPVGVSADEVITPLREAFASVEVHQYSVAAPRWPQGKFGHLGGWPQRPNEMFQEAAITIQNDARFGDFLWFEPDCVPTRASWLDEIESEYRACGKAILGVVVDTVAMDTRQRDGQHVVGVAVYPKAFAKICPLVRFASRMSVESVASGAMPRAFDALFGAYTARNCAETRLIQHFWRSGEFREEGGAIIAGKTVSPGVENVVSPEAVILHGCKDGSLLEIVRRRAGIGLAVNPAYETASHEAGPTGFPTPRIPDVIPATAPAQGPKSNPASKKAKSGPKVTPRPGDPVCPFAPGTPEDARWRDLRIASLNTGGFVKLRAYAKNNLKIKTFAMTADKMCEECVLKEKEQVKEDWVKKLKPAPAPQQSVAPWQETAPAGGDEINEAMRQKMLKMRKERGLPVPAGV